MAQNFEYYVEITKQDIDLIIACKNGIGDIYEEFHCALRTFCLFMRYNSIKTHMSEQLVPVGNVYSLVIRQNVN